MTNAKVAQPFLKWAGGKSQLLTQIEPFFPQALKEGLIKRYIEPFVGGGAVFLYLASAYPISEYFICDVNPELILAYQTIQKNVEELINLLKEIQANYLILSEQERKKYFYKIRSHYNQQRKEINFDIYSKSCLNRTSQLIFLNRTCFNGLFRVNSKGEFNVPFGRYKDPRICDEENLRSLAQVLEKTEIQRGDFSQCQKFVNKESFVYFDPPYRPISKTSNFNAYSAQIFKDQDQLRLRDFFQQLDRKGAKLMLSNSDPKNEDPNDTFFEEAYQGYQIKRVQARRNINSKGSKRGQINEILIRNY